MNERNVELKAKSKSLHKLLKLEKPKASSCAYVFFQKDRRKQLQEEHPDESFINISARLGEEWKRISDEEREYYEELSLIDKSRFKEEKRIYREQLCTRLIKALHEGIISPDNVDKSLIPSIKPPKNQLNFFIKYTKPLVASKYPTDKIAQLSKPMNTAWNALNPVQRIPYADLAAEDTERSREEHFQEHEIYALLGAAS